jgi:hypothetical protein
MEQRTNRNLSINNRNQIHPIRTAFIFSHFPCNYSFAARRLLDCSEAVFIYLISVF